MVHCLFDWKEALHVASLFVINERQIDTLNAYNLH